jgi:phosphatidylglycerophosphate synthase
VAESLFVVLPSPACAAVAPDTVLAGLTLRRRMMLAAERAGFAEVRDTPGAAGDGGARPRRIVLLAANVVVQPAWLHALLVAPLAPETLHVDGRAVAVVETADPARVLAAAARCSDAADLAAALDGRLRPAPLPADEAGRFALRSAADIAPAERWLLRSLIKPTEGFMSRHVERPISLGVTRRLVSTPITPNAMTLISLTIGLASAPFFLSPAPSMQLAGALLFLLHSILDGCDGELARLTFRESRAGALLDFWGDNAVHVAVFGCMALGWSRAADSWWPLLAGAVAIASSLGAAATVSRLFVSKQPVGAAGSAAARLTDALANRDFIYVVVLLAAFGRAAWFLVIAALGTPVFVLLLLLGGAARRSR